MGKFNFGIFTLFLISLPAGAQLRLQNAKHAIAPSGPAHAVGTLETSDNGLYRVGDKIFRSRDGKAVNGTNFTESTLRSFLGQNVEVLLSPGDDETLELQAIIPGEIYTSSRELTLSPEHAKLADEMIDLKNYEMNGRVFHRRYLGTEAFRKTLFKARETQPGDAVLVLTMSGAQGDSMGAVGGHFAFGRAVVTDEGRLDMEITNFYPAKNEKEIRPGHVNIIDYIGHLTSGQGQYRPVWTLLVYGVPGDQLARIQDDMNSVFDFLIENPDYSMELDLNCTTESVQVFAEDSVRLFERLDRGRLGQYLHKIEQRMTAGTSKLNPGKARSALFWAAEENAKFMPRKAFERSFENVMKAAAKGDPRVGRVDLIYQGQYPSARLRGGLPIGNVIDAGEAAVHIGRELRKQKKSAGKDKK